MTRISTAPPTALSSLRKMTDGGLDWIKRLTWSQKPSAGVKVSQVLLLLACALMLASGCEKPTASVESSPVFISLHGSVQGGQHPISGSSLQLYAAGASGVGSAAQPLLSQPARSDGSGGFSFSAACPSPNSQLYLTATEGNPGLVPGANNPTIALMAALGPCSELSPSGSITINEVTTVGSIWPLAAYMSSIAHLGYTPGDSSFAAAISTVGQLVDTSHGASPGAGVPTGWVVQTPKLYSLADLLDACVNSYGGSAGDGSACGLLFSLGGSQQGYPSDTVSAALRIAQAPNDNVINIFNLVPQDGAFHPTVGAAPGDWSLPLLPIPAAPGIDPISGSYSSGQQVTLMDNISGALIHYTTDGTSPSATSAVYTSPFALSASETVRAIAVAEGISSPVSSASYTISVAVNPAHLEFSTQPANTLAGTALSPAPVVSVIDSNGNRLTSAQNPITLSLSPALGLDGSTTIAAVQGMATFANLSVASAASGLTLTATSPGLASATSAAFSVGSPALTLTLSLPASSINVGSTMNGSITLSKPAASGGVSTMLASSSVKNASVAPSTVVIPAGQSTGSFTVNGVAAGSSTISATATGYTPASTQVTVVALSPVTNTGSVTTIEPLGAIAATQVVNGLGFNVSPGNDWEFKMAAAAGATHARYQCSWITTENQTDPPNNSTASPQFALQSDCQAGLVSAANYGIHSTIVAAYGSPFHPILAVTVPAGAPAGATSINVQFSSGVGGDTLSSLAPFYDTILNSSKTPITNKHSYAGGLLTGVTLTDSTHATLTLASALSSPLPANTTTQYVINQYLYPPPASFSPTDASVLAYAKYAEFLASRISASGITGEVEIWNEPPWSDDPWDDRYDFYDQQPLPASPGPQTTYLPNWGFAVALYSQASPVAGATYNWGGTDKSGFNSMLNAQMQQNTGVAFKQPNALITTESFHPYGNNPEDSLWRAPCLAATLTPNPATASSYASCNFFPGSNAAYAVQQTLVQQGINSARGIGHNITETGFSGANGDDLHKARFVVRQFLGYQAAGVTPIQFYRLYDTSADNFSFVNPTSNADGTHSPLPAYTALAGLLSDLAAIKSNPVTTYSAPNLPSVVTYSGTYPLDTVSMVGSRSGDTKNSILLALWQRSFTSSSSNWGRLASPTPTPVTIETPSGLRVTAVINLDTRLPVPYTSSGQQITFAVSDDPVEVMMQP